MGRGERRSVNHEKEMKEDEERGTRQGEHSKKRRRDRK